VAARRLGEGLWARSGGLDGERQGPAGLCSRAIEASKEPDHPQVAYGWWVSFLGWVSDNAVWMGKLVAVGEVVIGICLLLGLFTGVFAFLGVVLNFSFVFSGSAGVNPAFIIVGLLLVLAWRNAGWIGLDRFLLPRLGTPWQRTVPTRTDSTMPT
jgi:thiosulfate dehydrogenase (quinone) large subunit